MQWSREQETAIKAVKDWYFNHSTQVFRLFGYAGTGKTTIAKAIAEIIPGTVLFAAFTGKAAHILQTKGCENASTIHQLIYYTQEKSKLRLKQLEDELLKLRLLEPDSEAYKKLEKALKEEKENLSRPNFFLNPDSIVKNASLLIIDECSMVDGIIGQDLLSFGTRILVLGDPAQLPPIHGRGFFTHNYKPDFMLENIHRQALDNPIINLSNIVRNGGQLEIGNYGESRVLRKEDFSWDDVEQSDQILVGKNITRHSFNQKMRKRKKFIELIEVGDRLVCLRNNHDLGLLTGSLWNVDESHILDIDVSLISITSAEFDEKFLLDIHCHNHYFQQRENEISPFMRNFNEHFDYGYALTTHKAQGSQWDYVCVYDESSIFRENQSKWLYTAITRAAEKIDIIKRG